MKTKSLFLTLVLLALGGSLFGQALTPAGSSTGSITVNAANCNTTNACIILHMASSNVGYSVTVSGTWTGTLTVEQSGDNQGSWTSATTTTANTLFTSALTPGITDVRVRGSAAMTGTAVVTITASGPATLQQITQTGSSSVSPSSPAPPMGYYLSSACKDLGISNALCFTTPSDTQLANDCGYTSGNPTVTCSTAHFVSTDCVGGAGCTGTGTSKRAVGYQTCADSINLAANNNNNPFTTTGAALSIATFISATQVTLSANAASTVTVSGTFPQGGCFYWGHPDDAGATAMDAAMQLATFCPKWHLASANYFFTTTHFVTQPPSCKALGVLLGGSATAGNIVYASGFEGEGRGSGSTVIYLPTGFPESGGCANGNSAHALFVIPTQGKWSNLQITGGGNRIAPGIVTSPCILVEMDGPASMQDVVLTNFAGRGSANIVTDGIGAYLWSQLNHVNTSGWGTRALETSVSSSVTAIQLWLENIGNRGIGVGILADYFVQSVPQFSKYNFICYDCTISLESTVDASGAALLVNNGLKIKWYRGALSTLAFPGQTQTNILGYDCVLAGCEFDVEDAFLDLSQPSTGTGSIAINDVAAGTTKIKNTLLGATSGGKIYAGVAGSIFNNLGGVTLAAGTTSGQFTNSGKNMGVPVESGTVSCAASAVTITFVGTYLFNPIVTVQDQTTAGAVTQTSLSTTTKVLGCPGATDVLNYTVTPNPI